MKKHRIKLIIICPAFLPVPAVEGGAIETLIHGFIDQNEISQQLDIVVLSKFTKSAYEASKQYKYCTFEWTTTSKIDFVFNFFCKVYNFLNRLFDKNKIPISIESNILKKIIKNLSYDIVLVEGNGVQLHHLKDLVPKHKLVFHIHSYHYCINNSLNKYLMNLPHRIIAVSDFIRKSLNNNLAINHNVTLVLKNCIGVQFYEGNKPQESVNIGHKNKVNIVFTGRIVKEKGIIELIRALSKLKDIPNWHLHIIGSFGSSFGSTRQDDKVNLENENEIRKELLLLNGFYTIHGYIDNKLIPCYYNSFDLGVFPTLCKEAGGLVIGEFISSGIPVVASDQGGVPEYLDSDCGIIVKLDNRFIDNLSIVISDFLTNPLLLEKMSENCREKKYSFSSKDYFENFLKILKAEFN